MVNHIFKAERQGEMLGVKGRFENVIRRDDTPLFASQTFIASRERKGERISVKVRFDDNCNNGKHSFAITGDIYEKDGRGRWVNTTGGCIHDEIEKTFPELAPLIKWHLFDSDGPMHYLANVVYLAGDRDCWGLRKGEKRPLCNKNGLPRWELVAINSEGVGIRATPTGDKYRGEETLPLFILEDHCAGDAPPLATPRLEWRPQFRIGEGKARELDAARRAAVWPEATDTELCAEPAELRAMLEARLPDLVAVFRAAIEGAGFLWDAE